MQKRHFEMETEGFMYWHYWFGNGKQILERPFNEVLSSGKPDFPFCLGWANHSWTRRTWNSDAQKHKNLDLMIQEYPGDEDIVKHFNNVLPAFKDKRYIAVDEAMADKIDNFIILLFIIGIALLANLICV